jgi:hypothetical protein
VAFEQQLYKFLYYYQRSTCFGRVFRPSSESYKTVFAASGIVTFSCCLPLVLELSLFVKTFVLQKALIFGEVMRQKLTGRNTAGICDMKKRFVAILLYRGADNSLARPTSQCILFDGENISFDASLVIYINSTNIPPIIIINMIYENRNLLSLLLVSFLVGLRTYQHPCS